MENGTTRKIQIDKNGIWSTHQVFFGKRGLDGAEEAGKLVQRPWPALRIHLDCREGAKTRDNRRSEDQEARPEQASHRPNLRPDAISAEPRPHHSVPMVELPTPKPVPPV